MKWELQISFIELLCYNTRQTEVFFYYFILFIYLYNLFYLFIFIIIIIIFHYINIFYISLQMKFFQFQNPGGGKCPPLAPLCGRPWQSSINEKIFSFSEIHSQHVGTEIRVYAISV